MKLILKALLFACLSVSLAACGGSVPPQSASGVNPQNCPPDIETPCGGGYGGGGGDVPPTPVQGRITVTLYYAGPGVQPWNSTRPRFKAYTQYEENRGGSWRSTNASNVSIECYVNGARRDGETENNASRVDVTFNAERMDNVTCFHAANNGQYTTTSVYDPPN